MIRKIKQYMRSCLHEHVDPETDEINCTTLAEDAIDHFDLTDELAEAAYDMAFNVSLGD